MSEEMPKQQTTGIELIAAERERQISQEGWTLEHDDEHTRGELARAAACYAMPQIVEREAKRIRIINAGRNTKRINVAFPGPDSLTWPWEKEWWKPSGDPVRDLTKAGALIAAEIDRLIRQQEGK